MHLSDILNEIQEKKGRIKWHPTLKTKVLHRFRHIIHIKIEAGKDYNTTWFCHAWQRGKMLISVTKYSLITANNRVIFPQIEGALQFIKVFLNVNSWNVCFLFSFCHFCFFQFLLYLITYLFALVAFYSFLDNFYSFPSYCVRYHKTIY